MELRSCYFCGVAGRTVESRSLSDVAVTLCPRCEEKLARLRDATDAGTTETTPVTFDATADGEAGSPPTDESDAADESAVLADDSPGDATVEDESADAAADEPATEAGAGEPADEEPTDATPPDEPTEGSDPSDGSGSTGLRGLGADERGRRSTYRKALRLLRNREFPMARSDTVDLLASAYDLDREECEQLLDLCVDRGLLAEADGELREP